MISNLTDTDIAFFAMLVSLAALAVGPFVTLQVAKRQIVSPIRQKWIDELRELLSQYLTECRAVIVLTDGEGLLNTANPNEELYRKLLYMQNKLELMLNPKEEPHKKLMEIVQEITDQVQHGIGDIVQLGDKLEKATRESQQILKMEWKRVKTGDL